MISEAVEEWRMENGEIEKEQGEEVRKSSKRIFYIGINSKQPREVCLNLHG